MEFKIGDMVFNVRRVGDAPYFISSCGEVISERQKRVLRGGTSSGYRCLILCHNNQRNMVRHHHLVMRYFIGVRPEGMVINHKNGRKKDNRLSNLEYCTPKQNREHAKVNRLYSSGSRCPWSKLNEESVLLIKRARKIGMSFNQIARAFNVSKATIVHIENGSTWR